MARSLKSQYLTFALGTGALLCALVGFLLMNEHRADSRLIGSATYGVVQQRLSDDLARRATELSRQAAPQLAAALGADNSGELRLVATRLLDDHDVSRVEIRSSTGQILLGLDSSNTLPSSLPAYRLDTPLSFMTPHVGELQTARLTLWMSHGAMEAVLHKLSDQISGQQASRFRERMRVLAGFILPLLMLALAGAWLIARSLSRPISALVHTANSIGGGDLSRPLDVRRQDEIGQLQDAVERMRLNLRDTTITKNYLTTVLNSLGDAVLVTSPEGLVKSSNQAAQNLLGYDEQELAGKPLLDLIDDAHRAAFNPTEVAGENRETVVRTATGQTIPVSMAGAPISTEDPQFQGHIYVARNITERKRAERRIRYLARYDTLTKMPNRMQFQHLLQQAIARARRNQRMVALLYLDLDRFKEVNDTFGHAAGDRTLEILSERLTRSLSKEMVIGRLAGDEFAMFVDGLPADVDNRAALASLARTLLDEIGRAFYVNQEEVYLTASIGIAICPHDAENVIDLIRNADAAMYHSKQNGGNSHAFYVPDMNAAAVERLMLKSKLRRALERDELIILYQPKVELPNRPAIGPEALVPPRLPAHGDIPPPPIIPLAEETSLILEIGEWVVNRVCSDYRNWQRDVAQPGRISINLSLKQLKQPSFISRFRSVFRKHGVSPTCFELEVTETTLMTDPKRTIRLLNELYSMGLHLAIDDFGTGYSSLSSLQQFPISTLKIDQSFVRDVAVDPDDAAIVRTIIDMGRSMEMEVVAEGVEARDQLEFLRRHACFFAQGLLFGEVMDADSLLAILVEQHEGSGHFAAQCAASRPVLSMG